MNRATKDALQRGPIGISWSTAPQHEKAIRHSIDVIDTNEWAVAEFAAFTASGYTELRQVFPTKAKAVAYLRSLKNGARVRYVLLRSDNGYAEPNLRWQQVIV